MGPIPPESGLGHIGRWEEARSVSVRQGAPAARGPPLRDEAAAALICRECGVRVTRLDGTRMDVREKGSALVAAPRAHGELLARLVIDAV